MKLLVVLCKNHVVAVVEKPNEVLTDEAVALTWAKGEGYERFPDDCRLESCDLTTFGQVALKNMPYCEQEKLRMEANS